MFTVHSICSFDISFFVLNVCSVILLVVVVLLLECTMYESNMLLQQRSLKKFCFRQLQVQ